VGAAATSSIHRSPPRRRTDIRRIDIASSDPGSSASQPHWSSRGKEPPGSNRATATKPPSTGISPTSVLAFGSTASRMDTSLVNDQLMRSSFDPTLRPGKGSDQMENYFSGETIRFFQSRGRDIRIPESRMRSVALWDVTKKCDLRCIHCYNYDKYLASSHSAGRETTTEEAMGIVDKLADFGFDQIHFLGGEPLNRDDCVPIFAHARTRGLAVTINTNGIRLSGDMLEQLIDAGVSQVAVSIDGPDPESNDRIRGRGTFARVIRNLEASQTINLRRNSPLQMGVIVTLTRPLLEQPGKVGAFFPLLDRIGISWLNYIFLYRNSRALTNAVALAYPMGQALSSLETEGVEGMRRYPSIYVQLDCRPLFAKYLNRKHRAVTYIYPWATKCSAGHRTWLVEADGLVHPCGLCSSPDYGLPAASAGCFVYEPQSMMGIHEKAAIYDSEYFRTVRSYLRSKTSYEKFTTCRGCEYFGGACLPCPLYSPDGPAYAMEACTVEECEWSKRRIEEFYREQDPAIPRFSVENVETRKKEGNALSVRVPSLDLSFTLKGTGAFLWRWIDGSTPVSALVDRLHSMYPSGPDGPKLRRDVVDFLCHLRDGRVVIFQ